MPYSKKSRCRENGPQAKTKELIQTVATILDTCDIRLLRTLSQILVTPNGYKFLYCMPVENDNSLTQI